MNSERVLHPRDVALRGRRNDQGEAVMVLAVLAQDRGRDQ